MAHTIYISANMLIVKHNIWRRFGISPAWGVVYAATEHAVGIEKVAQLG
jgi:hypothetical protein